MIGFALLRDGCHYACFASMFICLMICHYATDDRCRHDTLMPLRYERLRATLMPPLRLLRVISLLPPRRAWRAMRDHAAIRCCLHARRFFCLLYIFSRRRAFAAIVFRVSFYFRRCFTLRLMPLLMPTALPPMLEMSCLMHALLYACFSPCRRRHFADAMPCHATPCRVFLPIFHASHYCDAALPDAMVTMLFAICWLLLPPRAYYADHALRYYFITFSFAIRHNISRIIFAATLRHDIFHYFAARYDAMIRDMSCLRCCHHAICRR